ncbi:MAG: hypothetical protein SRB2_03995 [Desulfobacteraceae bacterium Eth-SRB2]|nr:MAG: hypothetical protein SRB2_03995 [Desulfobacteraceae bacterium Eth-SRB2]
MFRPYSKLTLQIEPTRKCNLNCKICIRQNLYRSGVSLSVENFKKILNSGEFRYVGLHGWGEPLLNPQLFQMVAYAESEGIYTNLTTNGTLIGKKIDQIFSSGLREIAFGVYHKDRLSSILPQIKDLIREKNEQGLNIPKIYMDITIFKENLKQIPVLVDIASELGMDAVILHRIFNVYPVRESRPLSGGEMSKKCGKIAGFKTSSELSNGVYNVNPSTEYISDEEEKELFIEVKRLAKKWRLKLYLPQRRSLPCKAVKDCIFVTAEGKVTPCCFLPEFFLGDALKQGVKNIALSGKYNNFVKTMSKHPICARCPL